MKIYTTYFAKVRDLPPDIVPVSIAAWPPKGWEGKRFLPLSPTNEILRRYKFDGDWEVYTKSFNELLSTMSPHVVVRRLHELAGGKDIALVCYEKDRNTCHRSLVAKWLAEAGYHCEEYVF